MKNNEYTRQLSEIKAPPSAVEKAVSAALEADKNRKEVVVMPKKSNKIIKIVSAAAACAVVVTGVVLASNLHSPTPVIHESSVTSQASVKNSFSLIVNAAELTEENTVGISELNMSGVNVMGNEAVSIERIDDKTSKFRAVWYPTIHFPVVCRGNGIESVTYKINNALFVPEKNVHFVEEKSEKSMSLSDYYDGIVWNGINNTYNVFTVSYDEQLKTDSVAYIALMPTSLLNISDDDELTRRALEYLENIPNFDEFVDFRNGGKYPELRNALFKAEIQDVTVDITVNYTDGTNTTHTIAFIGKDSIDGISMPIEVTFVSELSPEEKAVVKGSSEYQSKYKLTLEKVKEIVAEALEQGEERNEYYYFSTVPSYIQSKIYEIQQTPDHTEGTDLTPDYTDGKPVLRYYYAIDAGHFEDCHKAIATSGSAQYVVYQEYDDDHNVVESEVLYDMLSYMESES